MKALDQLCREIGQKQGLGTGESLPLAGEASLWLVCEGELLLEQISPSVGPGAAETISIAKLGPGDFFTCLPDRDYPFMNLLSVKASDGARICSAPLEKIQQKIERDREARDAIIEGIGSWVSHLAQMLRLPPPPPRLTVVEGRDVRDGEALRVPLEEPLWAHVKRGALLFSGFGMIKAGPSTPPVPLVDGLWYLAEGDVEVSLLSTDELIGTLGLAAVIGGVASSLLHASSLREVRHTLHYADLLQRRAELDEAKFQHSLEIVSSVLERDPAAWTTAEGEDLLLTGCMIVGEDMGLQFLKPNVELAAHGDVTNRLQLICHHSGLRQRQVSLPEQWWCKDGSSLLGFFGPGKQPVALLRRDNYYEMVDPASGSVARVDETLAQEIAPLAFFFYAGYPQEKLSILDFVRSTFRKSWRDWRSIILLSLFVAIVNLFVPFASKIFFDHVIPDVNYSLYTQLFLGLVIASLSLFGFVITRTLTLTRLEGILKQRSQMGVWDRVFRLPARFFRKYASGDLVQRVFLVDRVHQVISGSTVSLLLSSVFSLLYLVMMFIYSWRLSFIGIVVALGGVAVMGVCILVRLPIVRKLIAVEAELNAFLLGVVRGIGKIRTAAAERRIFAVWAQPFAEGQRLALRAAQIKNIVNVAVVLFTALGNILIFWAIMVFLRSDQVFTVGTFIAFVAAYSPFVGGLYQIMGMLTGITESLPLWERTRVLFETEPESSPDRVHPGRLQGDVGIERVTFRYSVGTSEVLRELSLRIAPGEYVAIVGASGSGKSTLLRLLLGFEKLEEGEIFFDNKSLKTLDLEEVRSQCGVVLQGEGVFGGTLLTNLTCGQHYTDEQIARAVRLSGFDEVLEQLPMGLSTVLMAGGGALSGGQRQKLLLARALISEPSMLVLDEATSFLDSATQLAVSKEIRALPITRIFASHQLGAIRRADRICVLDQGTIVEEGTFEELRQRRGRFFELFEDQIEVHR
jgi:NHLM bacteriocin system ABC transporter ATP-binding protein